MLRANPEGVTGLSPKFDCIGAESPANGIHVDLATYQGRGQPVEVKMSAGSL